MLGASAYDLAVEDVFGAAVPTTPYMYVSLESIATLGLGDLARVTDSDASRCSEAVIGQVFLVTFVAMIVSRFDFGAGRGCTPGRKVRSSGVGRRALASACVRGRRGEVHQLEGLASRFSSPSVISAAHP